jgi:hypothetical protein
MFEAVFSTHNDKAQPRRGRLRLTVYRKPPQPPPSVCSALFGAPTLFIGKQAESLLQRTKPPAISSAWLR